VSGTQIFAENFETQWVRRAHTHIHTRTRTHPFCWFPFFACHSSSRTKSYDIKI